MDDRELLSRRVERERKARQAAEAVLEAKSRELFDANQELAHAAENLRKQMEKTQSIVEHAAEGIITVNQDCKIQSFNPAAEKIFGMTADQVVGESFALLLPGFSTDLCALVFARSEVGPKELIGVKADGTEFVIELTLSLIAGGDDNLMIAMIRDRTKRKQLETRLALAQKMESVGQLAAGIAHEINTPIQFVGDNVGFLADAFADIESLLEMYGRLCESIPADNPCLQEIITKQEEADLDFLREEVPQAIEQSKTGIDRVATIVRAMKEFSHPGTTEATTVDLNEALKSTAAVSRNEWRYYADLKLNLEEGLPVILGYPGDLNQAFLNIIINAAHAIQSKNEYQQSLGVITVATSSSSDEVEIRITDTGCGIPADKISRIFDPFFTTKEVGKGTGQGLGIAHQVIVEKHSGRVEVESEVSVGTTFIIALPIDLYKN